MAGLWCASLGFSERLIAAAAPQLNTLPYYHGFADKVPASAGAADRSACDGPARMARVIFAHQRLGCQRHRDQAGVRTTTMRSADRRRRRSSRRTKGVPRRQYCRRHTDRAAAPAHRLRSAEGANAAYRLSAPLSLRPGRRERRSVCGAARRKLQALIERKARTTSRRSSLNRSWARAA